MTSSLGKHLASYPCTAAGSRALAAHLRDDHGKAVYTSPYEDHAAHSAMHAAAHEAGQREPASAEPAGDGRPGTAGHEHAWAYTSRSTARTPPTAVAAARPRRSPRSA